MPKKRRVRRGRRPGGGAPGRGPPGRPTGRGSVLGPLATGLVLWALGLWSGLMYQHEQEAFQAQAVRATAVVDQLYTSAPSSYTATFDQYAIVHFEAGGQTAHARVLLATGCRGVCVNGYGVGQQLTVYYIPGNLAFARLSPPAPPTWTGYLSATLLLGLFGTIFLVAAVINNVTAPGRRPTRSLTPSPPR
jgi:hypothetical protein